MRRVVFAVLLTLAMVTGIVAIAQRPLPRDGGDGGGPTPTPTPVLCPIVPINNAFCITQ